MKTTVTLSVSEAETLLQTELQKSFTMGDLSVTIRTDSNSVSHTIAALEERLASVARSIVLSYLHYMDTEKIMAIKAFRIVTGYGLAESKWMVENFPLFEGFIILHKRLPRIVSANGVGYSLE